MDDNRDMEIHSYTIIHYGVDYLPYALRSIQEQVDKMHIIYTAHPSHGHRTDVTCPENIADIQQSIYATDGLVDISKIRFYESKNIRHEGAQRDNALRLCKNAGADIVLVLDYDEIWHQDTLALALSQSIEGNERVQRLNFTHLWRSFNWCCRDEGWPDRIIRLDKADGIDYIPKGNGEIYHFGYAIRDEIMRYKWEIHGHRGEMRDNWLSDHWLYGFWPPMTNTFVGDYSVHPTNAGNFWHPEPFDKNKLPELMRDHPFWGLEKIE